jgi:hypothetical protein
MGDMRRIVVFSFCLMIARNNTRVRYERLAPMP